MLPQCVLAAFCCQASFLSGSVARACLKIHSHNLPQSEKHILQKAIFKHTLKQMGSTAAMAFSTTATTFVVVCIRFFDTMYIHIPKVIDSSKKL